MKNEKKLNGFPERLNSLIKPGDKIRLAKACGVTPSAIHSYITGRSEPTGRTMYKISQYFKVRMTWLITGEDRPIECTKVEMLKTIVAMDRDEATEVLSVLLRAMHLMGDVKFQLNGELLPVKDLHKSPTYLLEYVDGTWRLLGYSGLSEKVDEEKLKLMLGERETRANILHDLEEVRRRKKAVYFPRKTFFMKTTGETIEHETVAQWIEPNYVIAHTIE
jgi:transcriptional regulator with XRE-family HTH domain